MKHCTTERVDWSEWITRFYEDGKETGYSTYASEEEALLAAAHFMGMKGIENENF